MAVPRSEVIERLKSGETLQFSLPFAMNAADERKYCLSGGGFVTKSNAAKIIPQMKALSNGLFLDSEPQEWGEFRDFPKKTKKADAESPRRQPNARP